MTFAFVAGGVGAVALVAGYFALFRGGKREPASRIAITPTFSPERAGATLRLDW
ncbi:MAG: hypothetical protein H0T42_01035 [Deltaproteobacteria bacterium]|nr:hypothetical protein [Deltaproteobacteria bacterium]